MRFYKREVGSKLYYIFSPDLNQKVIAVSTEQELRLTKDKALYSVLLWRIHTNEVLEVSPSEYEKEIAFLLLG